MALITEGETLANLANSEIERPVPSNWSKLSKTRALAERERHRCVVDVKELTTRSIVGRFDQTAMLFSLSPRVSHFAIAVAKRRFNRWVHVIE